MHSFILLFVVPAWLEATFWGFVSGSALLLGAALGFFAKVSQKVIAMIMGFGAGVLVSTLSFELMEESYDKGGFFATAGGFIAGGVIYTVANLILAKYGAKHRKRSGNQQPKKEQDSGISIALGSLLDGIPEAIAIGISMIEGGVVSITAVVAIFLSNIPEGLSSSAGMKNAGRTKSFVFGMWAIIVVLISLGSLAGYSLFSGFSAGVNAVTLALAAGAMLSMIADTMIPEAFEKNHNWVGLITVVGFLAAYMLTKLE